jgi:hypothetical protein
MSEGNDQDAAKGCFTVFGRAAWAAIGPWMLPGPFD